MSAKFEELPLRCKRAETFAELIDAIRLRVDVFIREQKCQPGWEPDELDKESTHFIAISDSNIVGALRVRLDAPSSLKIERMVTHSTFRGRGVGSRLLQYVLATLSENENSRIWMQAQTHARHFYESNGFRTLSDSYDLYGISHVDMEFQRG